MLRAAGHNHLGVARRRLHQRLEVLGRAVVAHAQGQFVEAVEEQHDAPLLEHVFEGGQINALHPGGGQVLGHEGFQRASLFQGAKFDKERHEPGVVVAHAPGQFVKKKGFAGPEIAQNEHEPRVRLEAQMHGGGHERGFRSGTLPTHQIVGMGEAFRIAREEMAAENERIRMLRDRLWAGFSQMEEVYLNGDLEKRVPHSLNASFNFVEGESLIMAIKDIAVSSGSACTSASLEPSYVLRALGRNDELAHSSIRFTIGRFTTEEDVDYAIKLIHGKIAKLRELSPLWEMFKDGIDLNSVQWAAH